MFSLEPANAVAKELLRVLTKESVKEENQWFFLEGSFSRFNTVISGFDSWQYEPFVVIEDKKIVAYFEAEWARPLNIIVNFRFLLIEKNKTISATKAFFIYLDYLFSSRGCDVFNWTVAIENQHAYKLYDRFILNNCGHKVGGRTRNLISYSGKISDSVLYEITKEEYFYWKNNPSSLFSKTILKEK